MIIPQSCSWLSPYFITFFIIIRSIVSALYITLNGKISKHVSLLLKNSTRKHCWVSHAVRSRQQSEASPVGCTVTSIHPNSTTGSSTAKNNDPSSVFCLEKLSFLSSENIHSWHESSALLILSCRRLGPREDDVLILLPLRSAAPDCWKWR